MIVTVTANPSLDRTLHLERLTRGAVHRAGRTLTEPSGKGVNVALALHATGHEVTAVLPLGGPSGIELGAMLDDAGLRHRDVAISGAVRSNVSVVEADGTTTKLNEPGPRLAPDEVRALVDASLEGATARDWVAWCGSLPAGFSTGDLCDALGQARAAGYRVALDTSDEALAAALDGPADRLPHLVKPNADELAALTSRRLTTIGDVVDAATSLVRRGVETVLVSLGGDGGVLVDRSAAWHGEARAPAVVNTAGAGDAFLAGYLAAEGGDPDRRLASALSFGAAAVQHEGTLFHPEYLGGSVTVGPADLDRVLES